LLERFCKIDKEYDGHSWNLLQILANINILIGEEPCEDTISRTQALSDYADWYGYGYRENTFYKLLKDMPPVTPKPKTGHWIIHPKGIYAHLVCDKCLSNAPYDCRTNYCPNCGAKMQEEKDGNM
jgi:hypothetical protein